MHQNEGGSSPFMGRYDSCLQITSESDTRIISSSSTKPDIHIYGTGKKDVCIFICAYMCNMLSRCLEMGSKGDLRQHCANSMWGPGGGLRASLSPPLHTVCDGWRGICLKLTHGPKEPLIKIHTHSTLHTQAHIHLQSLWSYQGSSHLSLVQLIVVWVDRLQITEGGVRHIMAKECIMEWMVHCKLFWLSMQ